MTQIPINMKAATRLALVAMIVVLAFGTLSFAQGQRYKSRMRGRLGLWGIPSGPSPVRIIQVTIPQIQI